jgi:hypothetical protein
MRIVIHQFKILEFKVADAFHRRIQFHLRQRTRLARELQLRLLDMVRVKMQVAERVDEFARLQPADLRDHQREQRIAGDVERHAEKNIRAALIHLAAQFAVAHIKLKQRMAWRQHHLSDFAWIPRVDDVSPAVRIFFDLCDDIFNLINRTAIRSFPITPLRAVNAAQISVRVRPFVPDRHAVVVEPFHIRVAAQKPEQFVNDGLGVDLLRSEQRKIFPQIESHLRAENGKRAGARAVSLELAVFEDVPEQIEVLNHRGKNLTTKRAREKEI